MGTKKGNKPDRRGKDAQATLDRIEQLLAESKRLQEEHAALAKQLRELTRRIQEP